MRRKKDLKKHTSKYFILVVTLKTPNTISIASFIQTSMYFTFKCLNTLSFHVNSIPTHKFLSPPRILSSPIKQTLKQSNKFSLSLFVIMDMMLLFFSNSILRNIQFTFIVVCQVKVKQHKRDHCLLSSSLVLSVYQVKRKNALLHAVICV